MAELTSMMNIGKEMKRKLFSVDIHSAEELMAVGAKESYRRLKTLYPNMCLVHLYVLEGAIQNTEYNALSKEKRQELKEFSDMLKG
ncbi:TfoX/Sxy family DNA transformation protein [Vermiculatibacterium agrestimuris]|uniref:TfoX/Sxy family DNA transformation protein n=1 Tax=Vermiculatibacterium agrestimuris TaxID=2941519 RepID=UPI00203DAC04|nr:TfoX/Sxy family DNA transformation protein [Vermiculatibacterium agrestimuris]